LYAVYTQAKPIKSKIEFWHPIVLCFFEKEMFEVLENAKTKKAKNPEKFFGFGFNNKEEVYGTRGFDGDKNMTHHLLKNKIDEIIKLINKFD
jgi:hypothetical protein